MSKGDKQAINDLRKYEICCPNCKKSSPLKDWGFVQTHWYESPHGCTEGDTWWADKDIKQCLIVCPNICAGKNQNLATRVYDFIMNKPELDWVFGLIQQITRLHEDDLLKIFSGHFQQYRKEDGIKSSDEIRAERESVLDLY